MLRRIGDSFLARTVQIMVVAQFLLIAHHFFQSAPYAPYLAYDDGLANVSHSIAHLHRYGFPASPLQATEYGPLPSNPSELGIVRWTQRLDGYFNFGPWQAFVGAGLSWLFGPSLVIQRALHLLGAAGLGVTMAWSLWRLSPPIALLAASLWLTHFHYCQWPVVRPDVIVVLLAGFSVAAATAALRTGRLRYWLLGAGAATAATTQHFVASAVALAFLAVWLVEWALTRIEPMPSPGRLLRSFCFAAAGFGLGVTVFLVAIDFRLTDFANHLLSYAQATSNESSLGWVGNLDRHSDFILSGTPRALRVVLAFGHLLTVAALALSLRRPAEQRRRVWAFLFPALAVEVLYCASLGFYSNWHTGYALLAQASALWVSMSGFAMAVRAIERGAGRYRGAVRVMGLSASALGVGLSLQLISTLPSTWMSAAQRWVDMTDYVRQILAPLPHRASVAGSLHFGDRSGLNVDLVQTGMVIEVARNLPAAARAGIAPDFVVLGPDETDFQVSQLLTRPEDSLFELFANWFPESSYRATHVVSAPPYGPTRVYARQSHGVSAEIDPLSVYANRGGDGQWTTRLSKPLEVVFANADLATVVVPDKAGPRAVAAARTLVAELPSGTYRIRLLLAPGANGRAGAIVATRVPLFDRPSNGIRLGFDAAPYFPADGVVELVADHEGGALFLSHFTARSDAAFTVVEVRRIEPLVSIQRRPEVEVEAPKPSIWQIMAADGHRSADVGDVVEYHGDASPWGYQVVSPAITVAPNRRVRLTLPIEVLSGRVALGILDESGRRWLVAPGNVGVKEFDTAANRSIRIVVANDGSAERSWFRLGQARLHQDAWPIVTGYADRLVDCLDGGSDSGQCLHER